MTLARPWPLKIIFDHVLAEHPYDGWLSPLAELTTGQVIGLVAAEQFRVGQAAQAARLRAGRQDHRGGDDGAGERCATGLVDAADGAAELALVVSRRPLRKRRSGRHRGASIAGGGGGCLPRRGAGAVVRRYSSDRRGFA